MTIIFSYFYLRFHNETRLLPVLWHQAFLTFVQRYKADISTEQRDALLELLKKQTHSTITPEVIIRLWNNSLILTKKYYFVVIYLTKYIYFLIMCIKMC